MAASTANRVLNYPADYDTIKASISDAQTDVLRDYLVARRRALLLESAHIERAIAQIDERRKVTR